MAADLKKLRHPVENSRFLFALIVVIPLAFAAIGFAIFTFGIPILALYLMFVFIRNLIYVQFIGNAVRVDEHSFPEIHHAAQEICELIGYKKQIDIFIYEEGSFNAMLVPFLKKKAVILNSETVHGASTTEIRWLIGRFVGYLQGKKLRFMWAEILLNSLENTWVFNLFLYPYERAAVLTGDRIGAYAVDYNEEAIVSALNKLMVGPDIAHRVSTDSLYTQYQELKRRPFFSLLARLYIPFPHMIRRVAEMHIFLERADFSRLPHPAKSRSTPPPRTERPRAASGPQAAYTVDPAFRREEPFNPKVMPEQKEAATRAASATGKTQGFSAQNTQLAENAGPGGVRFVFGLLIGLAVILAGDYMTFGFDEAFLPGLTMAWWSEFQHPELREFFLKTAAFAFVGMMVARLIGGQAGVPWLLFFGLFGWTLIHGILINPDSFDGLDVFIQGMIGGAALFGGSALLASLIPRKSNA
ncbi:MAG: hypothetical protein CMK09_02220 [Ponticaulis sp.]|nr:hypothetical protein [Ponticaulis sp.]|tara:strand:- start:61800 stop:63212 length:1413 start_codon:yes stop_codon:yes gene_type:complete